MAVTSVILQAATEVEGYTYAPRSARLGDRLGVVCYGDGNQVFIRALKVEGDCTVTFGVPVGVSNQPQLTAVWDVTGLTATGGVIVYVDYINVPSWEGPPVRNLSCGDGVARAFSVADDLTITLGSATVFRTATFSPFVDGDDPGSASGIPVEPTDWPLSVDKLDENTAVVGYLDFDWPHSNLSSAGAQRQKVSPLSVSGLAVTPGSSVQLFTSTNTTSNITRPAEVMALSPTRGAFAAVNLGSPVAGQDEVLVSTFTHSGGVLTFEAQSFIDNASAFPVRQPFVAALSDDLLLMSWTHGFPTAMYLLQAVDVSGPSPAGGPITQVMDTANRLDLLPMNGFQAVAFAPNVVDPTARIVNVDPTTYAIGLGDSLILGATRDYSSTRVYSAQLAEGFGLVYTPFSSFVIGRCPCQIGDVRYVTVGVDANTGSGYLNVPFGSEYQTGVGHIYSSADGVSWCETWAGGDDDFTGRRGVANNGSLRTDSSVAKWVAVGHRGVVASPDGLNWSVETDLTADPSAHAADELEGVACGHGIWVACGNAGRVVTSTGEFVNDDFGLAWDDVDRTQFRADGSFDHLLSVAFNSGYWYVVGTSGSGDRGVAYRTSDLTALTGWTLMSLPEAGWTYDDYPTYATVATKGAEVWVGGTGNGLWYSSNNGGAWRRITNSLDDFPDTSGGGDFTAIGIYGWEHSPSLGRWVSASGRYSYYSDDFENGVSDSDVVNVTDHDLPVEMRALVWSKCGSKFIVVGGQDTFS